MILFSNPKDFTPVCTTEFSAVARLNDNQTKEKYGELDKKLPYLRTVKA